MHSSETPAGAPLEYGSRIDVIEDGVEISERPQRISRASWLARRAAGVAVGLFALALIIAPHVPHDYPRSELIVDIHAGLCRAMLFCEADSALLLAIRIWCGQGPQNTRPLSSAGLLGRRPIHSWLLEHLRSAWSCFNSLV